MTEKSIRAIVLAAGRASRFNTTKNKLTEKICGQEMILYVTTLLNKLKIVTTMVVGYERETIQTLVHNRSPDVNFIVQDEQKGTGDALRCTREQWLEDHILILNGDVPLITQDIIEQLVQKHYESHAAITLVTAHNSDSSLPGYGRIVQEDHKIKIIEYKEFHGDSHEHCCINAGIYLVNKDFLLSNIEKLEQNPLTQEFYITDLVKIASDQDLIVKTVNVPFDAIRGVNTFKELWVVEQIKRSELISHWMDHGVRFYAAQTVHIDLDVTIGAGSYIGTGVHIINGAHVGAHCTIEGFAIIDNATIANNVTVFPHSLIINSTVQEFCTIGPFAHIQDKSIIKNNNVIGNFVQIKRSTIGSHTKIKHLGYIGDATVGSNVTIGAGTITCNYDGMHKNSTIIKDHVFVGSNNTLVAPVTLEENSYTAAGSVITNNVPTNALAIGRVRQINKEGYASILKQRKLIAKKSTEIISQKSIYPPSEGL